MGNNKDKDNRTAAAVPIKVETVTVAENGTDHSNGSKGKEYNDAEKETIESLMSSFGDNDESDVFVTAEEKEASAALERRRKRKRRLETLEASADTTIRADATATENKIQAALQIKKEEIVSVPIKKETETETTTEEEPFESDHGKKIKDERMAFDEKDKIVKRNNSDYSDEGNRSHDDDDDDSDSDESDMFGSPSSEDKARKKGKKNNHKKDGESNEQQQQQQQHGNNNNTKHKNNSSHGTKENSRQDGFDDSDGYYKASIGETMALEMIGGSPRDQINNESSIETETENEAWTLKLRVLGVIGKGVFSSVLKCSTLATSATTTNDGIPTTISMTSDNEQQQHGLPTEVAIKCIRSNETMAKAALDEMKFLIRLRDCPGIVPLLLPAPASQYSSSTIANPNYVPPPIDFRNHTILVFPYLPYNLRDVLQKFGKGVGLSLGAVQNYYWQLLSAAVHLQKKGVIHADIKPDNILVSADFSRVVVADFGSAFESRVQHHDDDDDGDGNGESNKNGKSGSSAAAKAAASNARGQTTHGDAVTPYLVSRFYRAPEIILGLQPLTFAIDLWSLAVTVGELFLGRVVLKGANNNDMLCAMMELVGPFSARIIKNHLLQTKKHPLQAHFSQVQSNFVFKQETVDPVLGRPVHKKISLAGNNNNAFKPTLKSKLLRAKSPKDTRAQILQFADLLTKCLVLDPTKRISVKSALKHKFFVQQQQQQL